MFRAFLILLLLLLECQILNRNRINILFAFIKVKQAWLVRRVLLRVVTFVSYRLLVVTMAHLKFTSLSEYLQARMCNVHLDIS